MRITIDIDDEKLKNAFARLSISPADQASSAKALGEISIVLFFEWLLNQRRFETMSQATEHYVATVEEKLYPEEPPNPTKLYDRYSLPLSRARYLARVLLARRSAAWRKGARAELLARLNEKKTDAQTAIQQKKFSQEFDCILSRPAFEELQVFYEQARETSEEARQLKPPKIISSFGQEITIQIRCQLVLLIIESINQRGV